MDQLVAPHRDPHADRVKECRTGSLRFLSGFFSALHNLCHEALHGHICHAVDPRQVALALLVHGFLWLGYVLDHPTHAPSRLLTFLDEVTGRRGESPRLSPSVC